MKLYQQVQISDGITDQIKSGAKTARARDIFRISPGSAVLSTDARALVEYVRLGIDSRIKMTSEYEQGSHVYELNGDKEEEKDVI